MTDKSTTALINDMLASAPAQEQRQCLALAPASPEARRAYHSARRDAILAAKDARRLLVARDEANAAQVRLANVLRVLNKRINALTGVYETTKRPHSPFVFSDPQPVVPATLARQDYGREAAEQALADARDQTAKWLSGFIVRLEQGEDPYRVLFSLKKAAAKHRRIDEALANSVAIRADSAWAAKKDRRPRLAVFYTTHELGPCGPELVTYQRGPATRSYEKAAAFATNAAAELLGYTPDEATMATLGGIDTEDGCITIEEDPLLLSL